MLVCELQRSALERFVMSVKMWFGDRGKSVVLITQSWNRSSQVRITDHWPSREKQTERSTSGQASSEQLAIGQLEQHLLQSQQKPRLLRFNACCFFSKATSSGVFSSSLTTGHQKTTSRASRTRYLFKHLLPAAPFLTRPDRTEREIAATVAAVAADRLSLMAEVPASESERSFIITTNITDTDAVVVVVDGGGDEADEKPKLDIGEEEQLQQAKEEKLNDQLSKENFLQSQSTNTSNGTSAKVTAATIGLTSISAPLHHHRQSNSSSSSGSSGSSNTNSNTNNMTSCQDNLISSPHPHHDSGIAADLDDTTQSATPLNLTMKKKRRVDNLDSLRAATFANRSQQILENNGKINHNNNNNHLPIARLQQQQQQLLLNGAASTTVSKSAFESVSNAALFSHEINMPSALSAALNSTPASPLLLNRLLPFTFLPNGGSFTNPNPNPNLNLNNNNQNIPSQSATTVHSPFNLQDLLFGGYFTAMPTTTTTTGKQQRPFKAYNPMDPMSALQINGFNFTSVNGTAGAALLGTMPVGSHQQQQLKAVLGLGTGRGASAAASQAVVRTKSTEITSTPTPTPEVNGRCASRASSLPLQLAGEIASLLNVDNRGNHSTSGAQLPPSPPEVTSTSHPHTDLQHIPNAIDHHHQQQQQQQQQHGNNVQAKKSQHQQKVQKQQKAPKRDNTNNNKAERSDQQQQQQQQGGRPASSSSTGSSNNGRSSSSVAANGISSPTVSDEQQQREESNNAAASVASIPTVAQLNGMGPKRKGRLQTEPLKDEAYWERRRKNNEAAKRSRDARRAKEDEIAVRAALLEQENMRLRIEVAALKAETEKLRQMLLTG
ncbi:Hepatic leukemia factor [Trichinella pseudospiralis]